MLEICGGDNFLGIIIYEDDDLWRWWFIGFCYLKIEIVDSFWMEIFKFVFFFCGG